MGKRKSKHATVRKSGQRGFSLYLPTWVVNNLGLTVGDEYRVESESKDKITLIREETDARRED